MHVRVLCTLEPVSHWFACKNPWLERRCLGGWDGRCVWWRSHWVWIAGWSSRFCLRRVAHHVPQFPGGRRDACTTERLFLVNIEQYTHSCNLHIGRTCWGLVSHIRRQMGRHQHAFNTPRDLSSLLYTLKSTYPHSTLCRGSLLSEHAPATAYLLINISQRSSRGPPYVFTRVTTPPILPTSLISF